MIVTACIVQDVVNALTIAYDILVGGLMVAIIGGFIWPRGTLKGAIASIVAGTAVTLGTMIYMQDVFANEPILYGIGASLLVYLGVSLMTPATPASGMSWPIGMNNSPWGAIPSATSDRRWSATCSRRSARTAT